jgi:signal transduction histidine kinase
VIRDFAATDGVRVRARERAWPVGVVLIAALAAWSAAEALWQWTGPPWPEGSLTLAVLWAVAIALPLPAARRAPLLAALAVVALVVARDVAGYRAPGSVAHSVVLLVALFAAEAHASPRSVPWRGALAGSALLAGWVGMDVFDAGTLADASLAAYAHALALAFGGVGAGIALRDRRGDADRWERSVRALEQRADERIDLVVTEERTRIAAEVESVVGVLLGGVRPLARRAKQAPAEQLEADMQSIQRRAQDALLELRRALHLLRGPEPGDTPPDRRVALPEVVKLDARTATATHLDAAVAASRRTRLAHALGWAAPVALLAALGLADQASTSQTFGAVDVPDPILGQPAPWLTAVVCALPLLARRRAPVIATLAVFALVIARMLTYDLSALTFSQFYVVAAATFLGVAHTKRKDAGIALTVAGAATSLACMALEQVPYGAFAYSFAALLPTAAGVAGLLVRDRVATAARARRAHQRADEAQEQRAREQVLNERLKAARELHDVVGHAVTVINLQAAVAARYAARDLHAARTAAATVLEVAKDAERELAALTRLLEAEPPPVASLEDVVARVRAAGVPITLVERLDDVALSLPLSLTIVRIVQEALTNVGRHAGRAPTTVSVLAEDATVTIEVTNGPPTRGGTGGGTGRGVAGMRERVEAYGGTLQAGPTAEGGWRVQAELPAR